MWWIVYFWETDPQTGGEFLKQRKFDTLSEALEFAQLHNARVQNTLTEDYYCLDDGDVLVWTPPDAKAKVKANFPNATFFR